MKQVNLDVGTIVAAIPVLKGLFDSKDITSLKLKFRMNTIADEIDSIGMGYQDTMQKLLKTFGEEKENGEYSVSKENMKEFIEEREEFLREERTINFTPLPLSLLEADGVTTHLTAREIRIIMPFIEDDTSE